TLDAKPHRAALTAAGPDRFVVEAHRRLLRMMTDGLDIVAVRVNNEGAVVIRMIVLAHARRAVVGSASSHRGLVERIDFRALVGGEGIMAAGACLLRLVQPELGPVIAIAGNLQS